MQGACRVHALGTMAAMGKHLQIRDVPDDIHDAIRQRAADLGMSMSALVLSELRALVGRPTRADLFRDIEARDDNVELDVGTILAALDEGRGER